MNSKKKLTLTFLLLGVLVVKAQVSIGLFSGYQIPLGASAEDAFINKNSTTVDFRSFSKGNIPMGLAVKYLIKDKIQLESNYSYLLNIDETYESTNSVVITYANAIQSLKLGVNYNIGKSKLKPIIGVNTGLYFSNVKINVKQSNNSVDNYNFDSQTSFSIGSKVGVLYELTEKLNFDIVFNYNYIFTEGTVNSTTSKLPTKLPFSNSQLLGLQLGVNYNF
jgi:hypothetical protein